MTRTHWITENREIFRASFEYIRYNLLPPGVYSIVQSIETYYFKQISYKEDDLLKFEDNVVDKAIKEISDFWKKKDIFERHKFPFKKGLILEGPPGSGKTSTVKLIINDIVKIGGIVILFDNSNAFEEGMKMLREVQPNTPVLAIMEDLDSIIYNNDVSHLLNLLDGLGGFENIVYLATTNYLNEIEDRIKNRPSRFDRIFHVDFPNEAARLKYFQFILKDSDFKHLPIEKWARDSEGLSIAHLKELFISVAFFENEYNETLNRLRSINVVETKNNKEILKDTYDVESFDVDKY